MPDQAAIEALIKKVVEAKFPQWKADYYQRLCTNLQVHTKGLLFSKVDTLFPNEHPDSKKHCVDTYEPITKGSIWKAINDISRIFSNSSFSVSSSDATAQKIEQNGFEGANLFNWFLTNWIDQVVATDANAYCAVYPEEYIKKYGGEAVRFVKSEHLKLISADTIAFVDESESAVQQDVEDAVVSRELFYDETIGGVNGISRIVKTYNKKVVTKIVNAIYHVFTADAVLRFWKEEATDSEYSFTYFPLKNTGRGLACFEAGGVEIQAGIKESFVAPFVSFGNLALLQHRNHRAVDLMFSYPRMSEIQTPCESNCHQHGNTGPYMVEGKICRRCKGVGFVTVQSPYKVYQKRIEGGLQSADEIKQILASSPVDFHTPEVGILNYSKDSWKEYLRMAEEAVFVYQKKVGADAESFESKMVDMEGKFSWLLVLSKAFFNVLRKVIQSYENYLVASPIDISIEEPKSFAILTEGEAFAFLAQILVSDAPMPIRDAHVKNFIQKFVSKSSPVVKALRVLPKIDPLWLFSSKDLQLFKMNSAIKPEAWTTHIYAYPVLMQLYEEDKELFDKEDKAIVEAVTAVIETLAPAPAADLKTALIKSVAE